jgi:hypothetical protein
MARVRILWAGEAVKEPAPRRLRAKPSALAVRGRGVDALLPDPRQIAEALEFAGAQRDRAVDLLVELERIITAVGGYMTPGDQERLREARALLVEAGRRAPEERSVWKDRTP